MNYEIRKETECGWNIYSVYNTETGNRVNYFATEEEAEEYALYLCSCARTGAETLHWSNPGDYEYDENEFEDPEYEIVEED